MSLIMSSYLSSLFLYHIRAPTTPPRSPPKPENPTVTEEHASDSEQPALVRFARLKQQEQVEQLQLPSNIAGPRVVNTPPNPSRWSVKDTSVNIASAFHQAASYVVPAYDTSTSSQGSGNQSASTSTIMNPNDSWASSTQRKALPRSTSVEYEKEQQAARNRLANPPPRSNAARPPVRLQRVPSARHVPDSEVEGESANQAKSPYEQVWDMSKKLTSIAPTTFFLRRQSEEPEARPPVAAQDQSSSYDYSAEEREFQASLQDKSNSMEQRGSAMRKRNRMSVDNKAYKPTVSDEEDSDEEYEQDGKRTRRKKASKGAASGHLTSLPMMAYNKKRKGRRGTKENGVEEDGASDDEVQEISESSIAAEVSSRFCDTMRVLTTECSVQQRPTLNRSVHHLSPEHRSLHLLDSLCREALHLQNNALTLAG